MHDVVFGAAGRRRILILSLLMLLIGVLSGCTPPPSQAANGTPTPSSFFFNTITFFAMVYLGYYVLVAKPKADSEKVQKAELEKMKQGDDVITDAGIYGKFLALNGEVATIEVDRGQKLRVRAADVHPLPPVPAKNDKAAS